jgi:hypothetical protein
MALSPDNGIRNAYPVFLKSGEITKKSDYLVNDV